jgi:hypothetical protein
VAGSRTSAESVQTRDAGLLAVGAARLWLVVLGGERSLRFARALGSPLMLLWSGVNEFQ